MTTQKVSQKIEKNSKMHLVSLQAILKTAPYFENKKNPSICFAC
jgi:hypothetical protein